MSLVRWEKTGLMLAPKLKLALSGLIGLNSIFLRFSGDLSGVYAAAEASAK
jgi:hypothetical protein